jgi:hypothetical protein
MIHDESTSESDEVSPKRSFFGENAPFHSKERCISNVAGDFIVLHPSGPFFKVSKQELEKALKKHRD